MRSKQQYQRHAANLKKVNFYSLFEETVPHTAFFWQPVEHSNYPDPVLTIFQAKFLNKNSESDKWEPFIFEMQPDRMFRRSLREDEYELECCYLHGCFLKKFNHYDQQFPNHKYGFRLQMATHLSFFIMDSAEQFKKWFIMLRRFCILEKFSRKYKVIAQLKYNDPIFGQICFNCVRLSDAGYYLCKIIQKEAISEQQKLIFFKEIYNLRRLNHPQLMRVIEIYEDDANIYQVFDQYMGGDLRQHLRETQLAASENMGVVDEKLLSDMMYGLIGALTHMHMKGVFHRDIKLDNLFVPENRRLPFVLLSNFCYSETLKLEGGYKKCGTPGYVAPEIFKTKSYDQKVDIYSLGIVFYILVYGKMPFEGKDQEEILIQNERGEIDYRAEKRLCKKISNSGVDLMKQMLQKDPIKRFNSTQALNHHWFIKMKTKDEQQRPRQMQRQKSLSTIQENSEVMELTNSFMGARASSSALPIYPSRKNLSPGQSYMRKNSASSNGMQQQQQDGDKVEKEFVYDSLDVKITWLNQENFQKVPSRNRHHVNKELN